MAAQNDRPGLVKVGGRLAENPSRADSRSKDPQHGNSIETHSPNAWVQERTRVAVGKAVRRNTYAPFVEKVALVFREFEGEKVTVPGTLTLDQVTVIGKPGKPSSITLPASEAASGKVMDWSGPASTCGAWLRLKPSGAPGTQRYPVPVMLPVTGNSVLSATVVPLASLVPQRPSRSGCCGMRPLHVYRR